MKPELCTIASHFRFQGEFLDAEMIPAGHINDTYVARFCTGDGKIHRYLLQRINLDVFRAPEKVVENIERITAHLRRKIIAAGGDPERETLRLVPTLYGKHLHRSPDGEYWRAAIFIERAQTYDRVQDLEHAYNVALAFGRFQRLVSDFPVHQLHHTIPDFHYTPKRVSALGQAAQRDVKNRARSVRDEIEFVERRAKEAWTLVDLRAEGQLPERVTHNDTKVNNVMIDDETGRGICVIDLDTVMPGLSLYDFGDAIRSGANPAAEDERHLAQVTIDLDIFERFVAGYLDAARDFLTPLEIDLLPLSAKLMTLECGMRFLTDHLNGDVYFRIQRENHNLDRCRTQFKMVRDMETHYEEMVRLVERYR